MERKLRSWRTPASADAKKKGPGLKTFLLLEGIRGPVRASAYDGWFQIDSFQMGTGKAVSNGRWGRRNNNAKEPAKRECSKPSYSEVSISKSADGLSALLFHTLPMHGMFDSVVVEQVQPDGYVVARWILYEVLISGHSTSAEFDIGESISFNFSGFQFSSFSWKNRPRTRMFDPAVDQPTPSISCTKEEAAKFEKSAFSSKSVANQILKQLNSDELLRFGLSCKYFFGLASDESVGCVLANTVKSTVQGNSCILNGQELQPDPRFVAQQRDDDDY